MQDNEMWARIDRNLKEEIDSGIGKSRGDSLTPLLFNLIIDANASREGRQGL